jgi:hypothetical protein
MATQVQLFAVSWSINRRGEQLVDSAVVRVDDLAVGQGTAWSFCTYRTPFVVLTFKIASSRIQLPG